MAPRRLHRSTSWAARTRCRPRRRASLHRRARCRRARPRRPMFDRPHLLQVQRIRTPAGLGDNARSIGAQRFHPVRVARDQNTAGRYERRRCPRASARRRAKAVRHTAIVLLRRQALRPQPRPAPSGTPAQLTAATPRGCPSSSIATKVMIASVTFATASPLRSRVQASTAIRMELRPVVTSRA